MVKFNCNQYDILSEGDRIEYLKKTFPIGCYINIKESLKNANWYISKDMEIVGYAKHNGYPVLKVDTNLPDGNDGQTNKIHPIHVEYNKKISRDRQIKKILKT